MVIDEGVAVERTSTVDSTGATVSGAAPGRLKSGGVDSIRVGDSSGDSVTRGKADGC
jgi:hypothetical protein